MTKISKKSEFLELFNGIYINTAKTPSKKIYNVSETA